MDVAVRPDPPAGEQEALAQALALLVRRRDAGARSEWWRQGVRENLRDDPDEAENA